MKKIMFTLIYLQSVVMFGQEQNANFVWAKSFGGVENEQSNYITVDASGNIYTTGYFQETVDFDHGTGTTNFTSFGGRDIFVHKMDALGNFLWARSFGGIGQDEGYSITIDAFGNIYTTGSFYGEVDFDPGVGVYSLASTGSSDVFVHKMDASGNFLWVKSFGGASFDVGRSIMVDASGNLYTTGHFSSTADFNPGSGVYNLTSVGSSDVFVHKMDASGNFLWAKSFGGTDSDLGRSITVDASGNVYTTGTFRETVDFNPGAGIYNLTSAGYDDVFIHKMNASGDFLWVKSFVGVSDDYIASIAIDASGNVYTTGAFEGEVDFDPGTGIYNLTSAGYDDIFVHKMDASGNFLWAKSFGDTSGDVGRSIIVDAFGNVYVCGDFYGTIDFDPGAGAYNLTSVGSNDVFVQKMDSNGNFLWAKSFGGVGSDHGISLTVDAFNNVYTTGTFRETADFNPETGIYSLTSNGKVDVFVHKMSQCSNSTGIDIQEACGSYTWIDGNTYIASNSSATYTLINATGCDSIVTLNLTINQATSSSVNVTECEEYTWALNNQTYTASGVYSHVVQNANSCDSTITLNLKITQPTSSSVSVTECEEYMWALNNQTYTATGTYSHVIPNANNCDSTITLNLTINNVDNTVSLSGITLTANQSGATYQWIDCNNGNTPISGETSQSFEPTVNGNYSVEVTANGCTETSACVVVNSVGIESLEQNGWSVYPNPNNGIFTVSSIQTFNNATIEVYSALGQLIYLTVHSGDKITIDLNEQPTGVYILKVNNQQNLIIVKL